MFIIINKTFKNVLICLYYLRIFNLYITRHNTFENI